MSIAGIRNGSAGFLAMQNLQRGGKPQSTETPAASGETRQQALQLLAGEKSVIVGESWPLPLPEKARTYAPRSGIETIKEATAEILRAAQAIPRENPEEAASGSAQEKPQQPSLSKNV